ncbi:hypothetical protein DPMN_145372 [Dreissena polymorpha]|uniref:Uncharacterized protein n=1 Tax=Dreissena polymorpha TaxID=45954 RepID=A0A9D4F5V8_DREPO|nr:hypothetical protein DPMN_145372 [Dreissena polymorpha]
MAWMRAWTPFCFPDCQTCSTHHHNLGCAFSEHLLQELEVLEEGISQSRAVGRLALRKPN